MSVRPANLVSQAQGIIEAMGGLVRGNAMPQNSMDATSCNLLQSDAIREGRCRLHLLRLVPNIESA